MYIAQVALVFGPRGSLCRGRVLQGETHLGLPQITQAPAHWQGVQAGDQPQRLLGQMRVAAGFVQQCQEAAQVGAYLGSRRLVQVVERTG